MTGLTSNPTILDKAIKEGTDYDADIAARKATGASDEEVVFALPKPTCAGLPISCFHPARTDGVRRLVRWSIPALAHNAQRPTRRPRPGRKGAWGHLVIKIPGTPESLNALEAASIPGPPNTPWRPLPTMGRSASACPPTAETPMR